MLFFWKKCKSYFILSCGINAKLIQLNNFKIIQSLNFPTTDHKTNLKKLSTGEIVVSAREGKIYFCNYKDKKLELINEFSITPHRPLSVYECNNNREIMILDFEFEKRLHLLFYDIKTKNRIAIISDDKNLINIGDFQLINNSSYEQINEKYVIVGMYGKICIINLTDHSIYKSIQLQYDYFITCALKLDDKNLFFSDDRGNIYEFEIDDKDINIKFKDIFAAHGESPIYQIAKYQENNILSSGWDGKIRVWKLI